jgi:competence protein ComEA
MLRQGVPYLFGLLTGLLLSGRLYLAVRPPRGEPITLHAPPTPPPIRVHVDGAVLRPGVYMLPDDAIAADAIEAAGGPAADADSGRLNLASPLRDGAQVYVPRVSSDTPAASAGPLPTEAAAPGRIPINTASAAELELLPGIGPSLAKAIIEYRTAHGPFMALDELVEVPGIGPAKLEGLREWVACP